MIVANLSMKLEILIQVTKSQSKKAASTFPRAILQHTQPQQTLDSSLQLIYPTKSEHILKSEHPYNDDEEDLLENTQ